MNLTTLYRNVSLFRVLGPSTSCVRCFGSLPVPEKTQLKPIKYRHWKRALELSQKGHDIVDNLKSWEYSVYMAHLSAVMKKHSYYTDPESGHTVMTMGQLLANGDCCGNGCRHCPFKHKNVPEAIAELKRWTGAFYS